MKKSLEKDAVPLYSRVASTLKNKILTGQFDAGSKLMTEAELSEHFNVSRITIRAALSHLENENLITRGRGKGTFVSDKIQINQKPIYTSVRDIVTGTEQSEIKPISINKVKVGETRIASDLCSFFNISNNDEVAQIHRVQMLDDKPMHFYENFMPLDIAKNITMKEIAEKKAIIRILKDNIKIKLGRGEMYMQVVPADSDIAEILDCQVFDVLGHAKVYFWFKNGKPFEIVNYYMPVESFNYKVDINAEDF